MMTIRFPAAQLRRRTLDFVVRWHRPVRRHRQLQRRIGDRRFAHHARLDDVRRPPVQVEMCRARRARHRLAPGLAQQARQVGGVRHIGREFRHRCIERPVREFLIGVPMMQQRRLASGQRDHRAVAEIRILQSRRQIRRTHRLSETDPRPAGDPRIAIGHIGRRLLGMRQHARDAQRAKLDQRAPQHCVDEEHMRGAVRRQCARQPFGACDRLRCGHGRFPPAFRGQSRSALACGKRPRQGARGCGRSSLLTPYGSPQMIRGRDK